MIVGFSLDIADERVIKTVLHAKKYCPMLFTKAISGITTGPRTRINPPDNESGRCGDLNHEGKRNAFSQPTVRSIISFAVGVI